MGTKHKTIVNDAVKRIINKTCEVCGTVGEAHKQVENVMICSSSGKRKFMWKCLSCK